MEEGSPSGRPGWQRIAWALIYGAVAYVLATIIVVVSMTRSESVGLKALVPLVAGGAVGFYFYRRL